MNDAPRRLDSVLQEYLKDSPLAEGLEQQSALTAWPEIVGPEIARHSRAESVQDGILRVRVESSVWAQELSLLERRILGEFDRRLGKGSVREVRFHSGHA